MDADEGKRRPDMVVRLPGGRSIAVDSKLSYQSYIDAMNATDETATRRPSTLCPGGTSTRPATLSKSYWDQFQRSIGGFVVLFLPGESFFSAR